MRFLSALFMAFSFLVFLVIALSMLTIILIFNNNINQDIECDKMVEYGYSSYIIKENFAKTCWLLMEDGISIRSSDYSIADNRNALRLNKGGRDRSS